MSGARARRRRRSAAGRGACGPGGRRLRRAAHWTARLWFRGPLYRHSLGGPAPRTLLFVPGDGRAGDAGDGMAVVEGRARFLDAAGRASRGRGGPGRRAAADLALYHGFDWLRDLAAVGTPEARDRAQRLIRAWARENAGWRPASWGPEPLSRRVSNWLQCSVFVAGGGDGFASFFLDSLARQVRHLRRLWRLLDHDLERLAALRALVYAALALPGGVRDLPRLLEALLRTCSVQFHPDGGHVSRSPEVQLDAVQLLADVRDAVRDAGMEAPGGLQAAILRGAAMVEFFRHGDGGLALFNGSHECDPGRVAAVLERAGGGLRPLVSARGAGYERIRTPRAQVLVDCGPPVAAAAGTLAFELSAGRQRIVVNCGSAGGGGPEWRRALRTTAAHSTLAVEDASSSVPGPDGTPGEGPRRVACRRLESGDEVCLEMSHDGYRARFGLVHHRRLYVNGGGDELRGEDTLVGGGGHRFDIRFHLHPAVRASVLRGGTSVLLQLPNRVGWRLLCRGGTARLEESVYLGRRDDARRSEQIVISGEALEARAVVNWALAELPRR